MFSGRKLGFTIDLGKLHNVSLGQGQEAVAEVAMEKAAKEGHWVILQVPLKARRMHLSLTEILMLLCLRALLEHPLGRPVARLPGEAPGALL